MVTAFIETEFFGEKTVACLKHIRKENPKLRITVFAVTALKPDDASRYLWWGRIVLYPCGKPLNRVVRKPQVFEQLPLKTAKCYAFCETCEITNRVIEQVQYIRQQMKIIFDGYDSISERTMGGIWGYNRLPGIPPYLTVQEIEARRYAAREKERKEIAVCLGISVRTVDNHLSSIRQKFRKYNMVGILKIAVSPGILSPEELTSNNFEYPAYPPGGSYPLRADSMVTVLSCKQAADRLRLSAAEIKNLALSGKIPSVFYDGKVRFIEREIEEWREKYTDNGRNLPLREV
jgi:DNA-binding CsgD family transcriptional regulator